MKIKSRFLRQALPELVGACCVVILQLLLTWLVLKAFGISPPTAFWFVLYLVQCLMFFAFIYFKYKARKI